MASWKKGVVMLDRRAAGSCSGGTADTVSRRRRRARGPEVEGLRLRHDTLTYGCGRIGATSWVIAREVAHLFDAVVSIGTERDFPDGFLSRHPRHLRVEMDDIPGRDAVAAWEARGVAPIVPREDHVRAVLAFVRKGEPTLIHCHAGVSRSSAMAIIAAIATGCEVTDAVAAADPVLVAPNPWLLGHGDAVLTLPPGTLSTAVRERWERWAASPNARNKP
jgi:predicted protein tyrosine phosphatase